MEPKGSIGKLAEQCGWRSANTARTPLHPPPPLDLPAQQCLCLYIYLSDFSFIPFLMICSLTLLYAVLNSFLKAHVMAAKA
jgi:hypothetical protein